MSLSLTYSTVKREHTFYAAAAGGVIFFRGVLLVSYEFQLSHFVG